MSKYLGITIGPIIDTLDKANTPASLWFASAIFSHISFKLCEKIKEKFQLTGKEILSPFFANIDEGCNFIDDGVGKYHDRVIVELPGSMEKEFIANKTNALINEVKDEIAEDFTGGIEIKHEYKIFLKEYIQIHYVIIDENESLSDDSSKKDGEKKNILLRISPFLDALELMQTTPSEDSNNIFSKLFFGNNNIEVNANIVSSKLYEMISDDNKKKILENKKGNIKSISNIAAGNSRNINQRSLKKYVYFAVVQADGDSMGKLLKEIKDTDDISDFSQNCLMHATEAAKEIGEYGGMPIYAGGDDLLFLAPVENDNKTVFELCEEIDEKFKKKMCELSQKHNIPTPSLSFGISIQYYRYPLYEARQLAQELLFGVAKNEHPKKNTLAVKLQKHSGQTIGIRMRMDNFKKLNKMKSFKNTAMDNKTYVDYLSSIIRTIQKNKNILTILENDIRKRLKAVKTGTDDVGEIQEEKERLKRRYLDAWSNFQDNPEQKNNNGFFLALGKMYFDEFIYAEVENEIEQDEEYKRIVEKKKSNGEDTEKLEKDYCFKRSIASIGDYHEEINESIQGLISYLNIEKFLHEKRQEGEFFPREEK